ncbi:hypothetical protein D7I44_07550 [Gryllotalpicola protaetiae]|uniref:Uncharacterized protein n=1 Tax=Gryllotalpicola protaetiae TaxID=2419771 RepID=A0A387BYH8_9MICO|nr:hypothetical protein D7I44_07550 [Gryllotalpicola protaetiae]
MRLSDCIRHSLPRLPMSARGAGRDLLMVSEPVSRVHEQSGCQHVGLNAKSICFDAGPCANPMHELVRCSCCQSRQLRVFARGQQRARVILRRHSVSVSE